MSTEAENGSDRPQTFADVAKRHPEGYRDLMEIAGKLGEDELARQMRAAIEDGGSA